MQGRFSGSNLGLEFCLRSIFIIRFSVSIEFRVLGFYLKVDYLVKEQAFEYNYILHGEFLSHNLAEAWLIPFLQLAISSCSTGTDDGSD